MTGTVGLSVGGTNISAVVARSASMTRRSVLTLYPHRPPELGMAPENPNIDERGLLIADFVERVGDPVGIVAADGSVHRADALVAAALHALMSTITDGLAPAEPATVAFPAHWSAPAVAALRRALAALPEWSGRSGWSAVAGGLPVISDATAALAALAHEPGLPARGVVALCDFGGTGSSITLADAGNGLRPIGPTVRHTDLSGELVDHALLRHVLADLPVDLSDTAALGSLSRLRADCRGAKERL
ncbi:MAG: molecular chaperone, partial [Mycobacteriaceae bacterium]|nr:molecular chaperone [Mycobacteriaceae bacterium]